MINLELSNNRGLEGLYFCFSKQLFKEKFFFLDRKDTKLES